MENLQQGTQVPRRSLSVLLEGKTNQYNKQKKKKALINYLTPCIF